MDSVISEDMRPHGVPALRRPDAALLRAALRRGWADMRAAPLVGVVLAGANVLVGWLVLWLTLRTGHSFWLVLTAIGFPLMGPFAAIGFYEISRRLEVGAPLTGPAIFGVIWRQRSGQLPWLCVLIVILFLFWFFLGHMIFALFLGLKAMVNVSSSLAVYTSADGLMMLGFGSIVGAGFALLLFSMTVIALPLLLDREVDFITAMLTSIGVVRDNPVVMLAWALFIAVVTFCAMIPAFLGLFFVLPWLGHASWHVYSLMKA